MLPTRPGFSVLSEESFGNSKKYGTKYEFAPIAQLVEQLPLKEMVQGSNPCGRTDDSKIPLKRDFLRCAGRSHISLANEMASQGRGNSITTVIELSVTTMCGY